MKANSTRILPATVSTIHMPSPIAIKIVCHSLNGGRTGAKVASVRIPVRFSVPLFILAKVLSKKFTGSESQLGNKFVTLNASIHSTNDNKPV